MSLLELNLRALEQRNSAVARRLAALPVLPDRGLWSVSRSGLPTVRRDGVALVSGFDPPAEALRAAPVDADSDFLLLPGLGAGYLAEAAVAKNPDLPLVIAEADPGWFREVLSHRDLTALWTSPWVVPLLGPDPSVVGEFFGTVACRTVRTLLWRPVNDLEPRWHGDLNAEVAQAQARSRVNLATFQRFGGLWLRNVQKNEASARNLRPLQALAGRWAGVPAVVAAAGPSLADTFGWMEAHRDRFVLIAVDTAWPALSSRGLVPDVLVVLDGQYANARHVDRIPPASTLVVTEWTGPPRAFRLAPGRTYVAATSLPFLRQREAALWGSLGSLLSGGSVATSAWSLAVHLGCPEVAFAGLDLAYPQGQTHVAGSQFEEAVHRGSGRLTPAETLGLGLRGLDGLTLRPSLDGGQVLSDRRMDLFREWLSAAVLSRPEIKAFNLGSRGSLVPGLATIPSGWGESWPRRNPVAIESAPPLVRSNSPVPEPPFEILRAVLGARDFPRAVEEAWNAAVSFWGADVWNRWAGRAKTTWDRFPSDRSRRAVEEVVQSALDWRGFWKTP